MCCTALPAMPPSDLHQEFEKQTSNSMRPCPLCGLLHRCSCSSYRNTLSLTSVPAAVTCQTRNNDFAVQCPARAKFQHSSRACRLKIAGDRNGANFGQLYKKTYWRQLSGCEIIQDAGCRRWSSGFLKDGDFKMGKGKAGPPLSEEAGRQLAAFKSLTATS